MTGNITEVEKEGTSCYSSEFHAGSAEDVRIYSGTDS